MKKHTGCKALPANNSTVTVGERTLVWLAPDEFLVLCEAGEEAGLHSQLIGDRSEEPLQTMAEFRSFGGDGDVYFAQNVGAQDGQGQIRVGSQIRIIERCEPVWNREAAQPE